MNANSELPALNRFIIGKYRAETVWKSVPRVAGSRGHRLPVVSGRGSRRNEPKLPFNLLPFCQLATETECPLEELQARERVGLALELVSLPQGRNTGQKKRFSELSLGKCCGVCARMWRNWQDGEIWFVVLLLPPREGRQGICRTDDGGFPGGGGGVSREAVISGLTCWCW